MKTKKITAVIAASLITAALFAGCSTTSTSNTASSTAAAATSADTTKQSEMKALYTKVLSALVTDKTITQAQSDKVLAALVESSPGKAGVDKAKDTSTSSSANSGSSNANTSTSSSEKPADRPAGGNSQKPAGTPPSDGRLSKLVSSNVITQSQADTINQKIMEAMKSSNTSNGATEN